MLIKPQSAGFLLLLGAMAALPPLSIDMSLPALKGVCDAFGISSSMAGLTLSLFMAGFCVTPVLYGPLSERRGRRPVLLAGLALFVLGGAAAALAPSIHVLLGARLLQGAGAGAGTSMAFAIVRDLFEGHEARRRLAYVTTVVSIAPMIAPTLGALVLKLGSWRLIYGILSVTGILLLLVVATGLGETARYRTRQGSLLGSLVASYRILLGNQVSLGYTMTFGLCFGVQFSFVSGSPLVLMGRMGVSPQSYGLLFACSALGVMAGALTNGRLNKHKVPPLRPILAGLAMLVIAGCVLLGLTAMGWATVAGFMPFFVLSSFGYGLVMPNISHGALEPVPQIAGVAGGMLTSVQMGMGALVSACVAFLFALHGIYAMTGMMLLFAVLAGAVYLAVVRPWHQQPA